MAGAATPYRHMSMYWSDVADVSFEGVGEMDSTLEMVGTWPTAGKVYHKGIVYYIRDDTVVGVMLWNMPGKV